MHTTEFVNENEIIYQIQREDGKEIARAIKCAFIQIAIECADQIGTNQDFPVTFSFHDYQGNAITDQNTDFIVSIQHEGITIATDTVSPVNGIGALTLEFAGAGEYVIALTSDCVCDAAEKRLRVNA